MVAGIIDDIWAGVKKAFNEFKNAVPGNVEGAAGRHPPGESLLTQLDIEEWLQSVGEGEPVIVVGHSVDAGGSRTLFLPSGESVPEKTIRDLAGQYQRECLILTCHGKDFRLGRDLTMEDAVASCRAGMAAWQKGELTLEEFADVMILELVRCEKRRGGRVATVAITVVVPAGGIGAYHLQVSYGLVQGLSGAAKSSVAVRRVIIKDRSKKPILQGDPWRSKRPFSRGSQPAPIHLWATKSG